MAKEYIDREKIAAEARGLSTHLLNEWDTIGVLALIDRQPAADVVEVRHGRWIGTHDGFYYTYSCSECGYEALYEENTTDQVCSKHCPNCGAKMEGEE